MNTSHTTLSFFFVSSTTNPSTFAMCVVSVIWNDGCGQLMAELREVSAHGRCRRAPDISDFIHKYILITGGTR